MKLNEKHLINASKIIFLLFALYLIFQIARASLGWAIVTAAFLFLVACWLHREPKSDIVRNAREQNELIKGGTK
jgi:uncharacterized membrane protein